MNKLMDDNVSNMKLVIVKKFIYLKSPEILGV